MRVEDGARVGSLRPRRGRLEKRRPLLENLLLPLLVLGVLALLGERLVDGGDVVRRDVLPGSTRGFLANPSREPRRAPRATGLRPGARARRRARSRRRWRRRRSGAVAGTRRAPSSAQPGVVLRLVQGEEERLDRAAVSGSSPAARVGAPRGNPRRPCRSPPRRRDGRRARGPRRRPSPRSPSPPRRPSARIFWSWRHRRAADPAQRDLLGLRVETKNIGQRVDGVLLPERRVLPPFRRPWRARRTVRRAAGGPCP